MKITLALAQYSHKDESSCIIVLVGNLDFSIHISIPFRCMENYCWGSLDLQSKSIIHIKTIHLEKKCCTCDMDVLKSNLINEKLMWIL